MAERKPQWPENGDLVIATIETVTDYGAYAKLDEFEKRGLLHVSEISSNFKPKTTNAPKIVMQKTADNIVAYVHKAGGEGNFRREK